MRRLGVVVPWMHDHEQTVLSAVGDVNGIPVTIIVAVDWTAPTAAELAKALVAKVQDVRRQATSN